VRDCTFRVFGCVSGQQDGNIGSVNKMATDSERGFRTRRESIPILLPCNLPLLDICQMTSMEPGPGAWSLDLALEHGPGAWTWPVEFMRGERERERETLQVHEGAGQVLVAACSNIWRA
jgi:hypothetical protein